MQLIKKVFTIALITLSLFTSSFLLANEINASCTVMATCDAAPGTCGSTCNGGGSCIINQGIVTRTCSNPVMVQCENCSATELARDPYCQPTCEAVDGCPEGCQTNPSGPGCSSSVTSCVDTIWAQCCTPGTPPGTCGDGMCTGTEGCNTCVSDCGVCAIQRCGDGSCNAGETCGSCATDCGSCNTCGDGQCLGGENCSNCIGDCGSCPTGGTCGNGSCDSGEWCGNCAGDCGQCTSCGDGSCNAGENCSSCSSDCGSCQTCGDGSCNGAENCSSCATDCGSCSAPSFCGDFTCSAFESCSTCASDCGACAENEAWFQVSGGHIGSANDGNASVAIQSKITDTQDCVAPNCIRSLLTEDKQSTDLTDGFAVVGNGVIDANGVISQRSTNTYSLNTTKSRYQERYEYFYRNSGLGNTPSDDFALQATDAQKPTYNAAKIAYYRNGNLTVQNPWNVASGEKYVIFVDGNLTLTDGNGSNDALINVQEGGFLAFIVKGNITIDASLGNATLTSTTANLEGVYMADGTLTTATRGTAGGGDDRFIGEGVFVGWSGVDLNRDFSDGSSRSLQNNDKPAETFIYRPDFLVNMPDIMLVPIRLWQETN